MTDDSTRANSGENDQPDEAEDSAFPLDRRRFLQATASGSLLGGAGAAGAAATQDDGTGPTVYVCSEEAEKVILHAVDATDGTERWRFEETDGAISFSPTVVDGVVYASMGPLYAVDATSGNKKWEFSSGISSSPTVVDGVVYVGAANGMLYAVNTDDGNQKWQYDTGSRIERSAPTVANGVVYVASSDGKLHAVNVGDGSKKGADDENQNWPFAKPSQIRNVSPTVADGVVYIPGSYETLYAVDAADGTEEWAYDEATSEFQSSPTVVDGVVYVVSEKLHAVDAAGNQKWTFALSGGVTESSPTVADGVVYIGSEEDNLYAVDATNGNPRDQNWPFSQPTSDIKSSPTVADGVVYVGSKDETLYAVNATDGSQEWAFTQLSRQITLSSPTIVKDPENGSSVGSRVKLQTLGHHNKAEITSTPEKETISGEVTDFKDNSVPNTDVYLYETNSTIIEELKLEPVLIGETSTDSNGEWQLSVTEPSELTYPVFVIAKKAKWFDSQEFDQGELLNQSTESKSIDLRLEREFLLDEKHTAVEPSLNSIDISIENSNYYGTVSTWRKISGDGEVQQLYTMLHGTKAITSKAGSIKQSKARIKEGTLTVQVPENINIDPRINSEYGIIPNTLDPVNNEDETFLRYSLPRISGPLSPATVHKQLSELYKPPREVDPSDGETAAIALANLLLGLAPPGRAAKLGTALGTAGALNTIFKSAASSSGEAFDNSEKIPDDMDFISDPNEYDTTVFGHDTEPELEGVPGLQNDSFWSMVYQTPINFGRSESSQADITVRAVWRRTTDTELSPESSELVFNTTISSNPVAPGKERHSESKQNRFIINQGDINRSITPLSYNNQTVEEFYGYEDGTSNTPTGVEKSDTSRLFLYDGSKGLSLVIIHDKADNGARGAVRSAEFDFSGLPTDTGSWVVQDDTEGKRFTRDDTSPVWAWYSNGTDGGAFRGGLNNGFDIEITPAFDGITDWEFLSGDPSDPDVTRLNIDESVKITRSD